MKNLRKHFDTDLQDIKDTIAKNLAENGKCFDILRRYYDFSSEDIMSLIYEISVEIK